MPRFTNEPGAMSRATSWASSSRPSGVVEVWMDVVVLMSGHLVLRARTSGSADADDAVDVDSGSHDVLRVERAGGHDLGDLDDGVLRGCCHDGAEVPGRLPVDEVALAVRLE